MEPFDPTLLEKPRRQQNIAHHLLPYAEREGTPSVGREDFSTPATFFPERMDKTQNAAQRQKCSLT
jgi:hypothetical protein